MDRLKEMLSYRRPAYSTTEQRFIDRFITPLNPTVDEGKNRIVLVGESRTMFACHTDTVHRIGGTQGIRQTASGLLYTTAKKSNCLGADCTAGVWLMVNMIERKIPGIYVFHAAEEVGCLGAKYIEEHTPGLLEKCDRSIEFDRFGCSSIVTHQMGNRCASDEFSSALGRALDMGFALDREGIFTDNETYAMVIPEVVNLSVGYTGQHGKQEMQDPNFLMGLLDRLCKVEWEALPVARDPSVTERDSLFNNTDFEPSSDLCELCYMYPEAAASLLAQHGLDGKDMRDEMNFLDIIEEIADKANEPLVDYYDPASDEEFESPFYWHSTRS